MSFYLIDQFLSWLSSSVLQFWSPCRLLHSSFWCLGPHKWNWTHHLYTFLLYRWSNSPSYPKSLVISSKLWALWWYLHSPVSCKMSLPMQNPCQNLLWGAAAALSSKNKAPGLVLYEQWKTEMSRSVNSRAYSTCLATISYPHKRRQDISTTDLGSMGYKLCSSGKSRISQEKKKDAHHGQENHL